MSHKSKKQLLIISGYSGGGKSVALRYLEEIGFYCVDNLPARLLPLFTSLLLINKNIFKIAIVIDARGKDFMTDLEEDLSFVNKHFETRIIFFDCSLQTIIKRFKERRLKHPIALHGTIIEGYRKEQRLLTHLRQHATLVINTSQLNIHALKFELHKYLLKARDDFFEITLISFGYKFGLPEEADVVIDARLLQNPYFEPKLKKLTGQNKKVQHYIFDNKMGRSFLAKTISFISFLANHFNKASKANLTIAIGCTGGKHRKHCPS